VFASLAPGSTDWVMFEPSVPENMVDAMTSNRDLLQVISFAALFGVAVTSIERSKAKPIADFVESLNEDGRARAAPAARADPVDAAGRGVAAPGPLASHARDLDHRVLDLVLERHLAGHARDRGKLGVPRPVASFVLPLGATVNMDGTTIYQVIGVHFVAQVWLTLVLLAMVMAIGVPGGVIPLLYVVMATVGIPDDVIPQGIALILGVDRLLDMCRSALNVMGDVVTASIVAALQARRAPD